MAKQSPLSGMAPLVGESEEELAKIQEIQEGYKKLRETLDSRQNRLFDPTLLAMAQGFLAPTKTGSFGESIANAAEKVLPVMDAEERRAREIAAMKLELSQKELGQLQATRGMKTFQQMMGEGTASAKLTGVSEGAPAAPGVAVASGANPPPPGAPGSGKAGWKSLSETDILKLKANPATAKYGDMLAAAIKMDRDRFQIAMNGIVFDRATQRYIDVPIPGQKQESFNTRFGTYSMTPYEYSQYQKAENEGKGAEWMAKFTGRPTESIKPSGRLTESERGARSKGAETTAAEEAKADVTRGQAIIADGQKALAMKGQLNYLKTILKNPEVNKLLGVFENEKAGDAVLKLIESGIVGNALATGIRDIFTNFGISAELKATQLAALQGIGSINLEMRKITRTPGEGAMSDFESKLALAAGLDKADTPMGMRKKIEFLNAKFDYNRELAKEFSRLKKDGMSSEAFLFSPEFERISADYANNLQRIVMPFVEDPSLLPPSPVSGATSGGAGAPVTADDIRRALD